MSLSIVTGVATTQILELFLRKYSYTVKASVSDLVDPTTTKPSNFKSLQTFKQVSNSYYEFPRVSADLPRNSNPP